MIMGVVELDPANNNMYTGLIMSSDYDGMCMCVFTKQTSGLYVYTMMKMASTYSSYKIFPSAMVMSTSL